MTTLFWCIVIITAVHVFQVSGISIGTCNLDSEINLLSTKEKQKLSIYIACMFSFMLTNTLYNCNDIRYKYGSISTILHMCTRYSASSLIRTPLHRGVFG